SEQESSTLSLYLQKNLLVRSASPSFLSVGLPSLLYAAPPSLLSNASRNVVPPSAIEEAMVPRPAPTRSTTCRFLNLLDISDDFEHMVATRRRTSHAFLRPAVLLIEKLDFRELI
ncbi:hypothetical protein LINGRAPRIM_LOCUS53, partial [Linum grandiflorum]